MTEVMTAPVSEAALRRLGALLQGRPATVALTGPAWPTADGGTVRVPEEFVLAVRGADGDPEMEWDDLVEQWVATPEAGGLTVAAAGELLDELRASCGAG